MPPKGWNTCLIEQGYSGSRTENAVADVSVVCVETYKDEQMNPWIIGKEGEPVFDATRASPPQVPERDVI